MRDAVWQGALAVLFTMAFIGALCVAIYLFGG